MGYSIMDQMTDRSGPIDGVADRSHLLEHNRDALLRGLGPRAGLENMVGLIIDADDALGAALAARIDPDGVARDIAGKTAIPTVLAVMELEEAHALMKGADHPGVADGLLVKAGAGMLRILVIGGGGVTLVHSKVYRQPAAAEA